MTGTAIVTSAKDLVAFDREKVDDFIKKLRDQETSIIGDISTPAGRAEIASRAYNIAKIKNEVDRKGKMLKEEAEKVRKTVDAERGRIWDDLEKLQHDVRAPLTEWENAEERRVTAHEERLKTIAALLQFDYDAPMPEEIDLRLDDLEELAQADWQEFAVRAKMSVDQVSDGLRKLRERRAKEIADAEELARLRREQEEREQKERDDKIAADAAEKARLEAEAEAERVRLEEAERAETERVRLENEKREQEERAVEAECNELAALAQGWDERRRSEIERIAREKRDEAARLAAAEEAEHNAHAAVAGAWQAARDAEQAERDRQAKAKAEEHAAAKRREEDIAHRRRINLAAREAMQAVVDAVPADGSIDAIQQIIIAIAQGKIPNVKIFY